MAYYGRDRSPSFFDNFTLNPLPYPVLVILLVISLLLGLQWYSDYESVVESAEEGLGWALFVVPVALLFLVRWLSGLESGGGGGEWWMFGGSAYDRRVRNSYWGAAAGEGGGGGSPWGVAALIVVLLVLVQFHGTLFE